MKKNPLLWMGLLFLVGSLHGQKSGGYQTPPESIAALVNAPVTPGLSFSPDRKWMLFLEQPGYPSIQEVAQPELRLAGIRINPRTNGPSRAGFISGLTLQPISSGSPRPVQRLPANPAIQFVSWSPDGTKIAFIHTEEAGLSLWVVDVKSATARIQTGPMINAAMPGQPYIWLDNEQIVCAMIPAARPAVPQPGAVPAGPVIQFSEGKAAAVRTYQDLLTDEHDESLFEYYTTAQLSLIQVNKGVRVDVGTPGIITDFIASPDGKYLLVTRLQKPFSYLVPYNRFPQNVEIWDTQGQVVRTLAKIPLTEDLPQGFDAVPKGPRRFDWRADVPATIYWVEAQDGGNPRQEAAVRDKLFSLDAPFSGQPVEGLSFQLRFRGIAWGSDNLALASEGWWSSRRQITWMWKPNNLAAGKETLFDRSTEDRYKDPGNFVTQTNKYGRSVLLMADGGNTLYLTGSGASPEGNQPFLDRMDRQTMKISRLWRSVSPYYEMPVTMVDPDKSLFITRRESEKETPNYYLRNFKSGDIKPLTRFTDPYPGLAGVNKELVRYKRSDGIELTGTLFLPAGYDKTKDGPLPVIMWAYPREFKSADAAGQVTTSPHEFIRLNWGSPLYFLTQGYAVFDNFSMPIIGEGDAEPNETFVPQLRDNAEAAIRALVDMGVADPQRIAVGGHSYGAFMTANLLAHTNLFAAGIARSGAYNRTLTPFGFQSEERTYWQAPEVYFQMSPFNFADKIKTPILLIHGEADNNSGTFPIQSERFYAALKGHGATVRYVVLPAESHGYRARESILHMLWETNEWLNRHVKYRKAE